MESCGSILDLTGGPHQTQYFEHCSNSSSSDSDLAHKIAPVLGDGIISASTFLDWENACDDFFKAAKDPISDDKKVSKVTGSDAITMLLAVEIAQIAHIHKDYKIGWTS